MDVIESCKILFAICDVIEDHWGNVYRVPNTTAGLFGDMSMFRTSLQSKLLEDYARESHVVNEIIFEASAAVRANSRITNELASEPELDDLNPVYT